MHIKDLTIKKIGKEWCAFHPNGREIVRSEDKSLFDEYLRDSFAR